jgi:transcriptional regulator with XRE-family HTH domain
MYLAARLKDIRESKQLSQGDIEKRTGLLRCYISRVENGHTVPSLETLEKISRALETPLYQVFYGVENGREAQPPSNGNFDWASRGKGQRWFAKFRDAVAHMSDRDRAVLLFTAAKLVELKRKDAYGAEPRH